MANGSALPGKEAEGSMLITTGATVGVVPVPESSVTFAERSTNSLDDVALGAMLGVAVVFWVSRTVVVTVYEWVMDDVTTSLSNAPKVITYNNFRIC